MQSSDDTMILITPAFIGDAHEHHEPRDGSRTHGRTGSANLGPGPGTNAQEVKTSTVIANLQQSMEPVRGVLQALKREAIEGWELDEATVCLAVDANGSCGIAAAGVPASLEIRFVPASRPEPSEETS